MRKEAEGAWVVGRLLLTYSATSFPGSLSFVPGNEVAYSEPDLKSAPSLSLTSKNRKGYE